jgi:hypothetical protein
MKSRPSAARPEDVQGSFRPLSDGEIRALTAQGCSSGDWNRVRVADPLRIDRIRQVHFFGDVTIGRLDGETPSPGGCPRPSGIYHATVAHAAIGDGARIAAIRGHLTHYDIGKRALIEDVGVMETRPGARFGNGVDVEVLNEAGGRDVVLFNALSSQLAHLICLYRHRPRLQERLQTIVRREADGARADRGSVGAGARIVSVRETVDVEVGPGAELNGCSSLVDGTVLSSPESPTRIGSDVLANQFIAAEGAEITGGAQIRKCYVGQGCQIGKQFSADACLFFANCEAFHGEACSVFAGPYTVTHHKSTLLIAGYFSFYNAGSGTNQSNHMYKLGPVHEGKLERGCKTGSFAYLMWPCRIGAFSVVLGKYKGPIDTSGFPFSLLEAGQDGRCHMVPGLNLGTVGTVRDGMKWPSRDRRHADCRRDRLTMDVFSPWSVARMERAAERLAELQESTDRDVEAVRVGGASIKRVLFRTGQKYYRAAVQLYLLEKLTQRMERTIEDGASDLTQCLAAAPESDSSRQWVDVGGQLMPAGRLERLLRGIEEGRLNDVPSIEREFDEALACYADDEWAWVHRSCSASIGLDLSGPTHSALQQAVEGYRDAKQKYVGMVLADATKEFEQPSRTGFGPEGTENEESVEADFRAVRGDYDTNRFVRQMRDELDSVQQRTARILSGLGGPRAPRGS